MPDLAISQPKRSAPEIGRVMTNIAFERFRNCFVLVQNQYTASDAEWEEWLEFATGGGPAVATLMRVLIFSAGGAPTPKQRSQVHALTPKSGNGVRTAVVTPSFVGRTVVGAMALFNRNTEAFAPSSARRAFDYLGVPGPVHHELLERVYRLHQQLNISCQVKL